MPIKELRGKVAVITGAASGLGLAMAERFGAEGMRLLLADIDDERLHAAGQRLDAAGVEVQTLRTDVSKESQIAALADFAYDRFGAVHLLCNNAGVAVVGTSWERSTADWAWAIGVNLWSVVHGVRSFVPRMLDQGVEGHIVNTASMAGLVAPPFMGPYNASKFAVVAITESLRAELEMSGSPVGTSVLCPGWVNTRIHESDRNRPDALRNPVEREMTPENEGIRTMMQTMIATGMHPDEVAGRVVDAIRTNDLYVLTHPEMAEGIRGRMQRILDHLPGA